MTVNRAGESKSENLQTLQSLKKRVIYENVISLVLNVPKKSNVQRQENLRSSRSDYEKNWPNTLRPV